MDFEFKHPDYANLVSGNSPYNTGSYSISRIVTQVGFNWSDVGLATPTGSVRFCLYRNDNYTGYTISNSVNVGIAIQGRFTITDNSKWETLQGGVSKRTTGEFGKYKLAQWNSTQQKWVEQGYYATFKITIHEGLYDNDPTKPFSLLYLSKGPLSEDTYIPYQFYVVGSDSPYVPNARILKNEADYSSGDPEFNFINTIGAYFYDPSVNMEVTFDVNSDRMGNYTIYWRDLLNPSLPRASYNLRFGYTANDNPYGTIFSYNATPPVQINYGDYLSYLYKAAPQAYEEAVNREYTYINLELFHNEGSTAVVDLRGIIKVDASGGLTDETTNPNCHVNVNPYHSNNPNDEFDDGDEDEATQAPGQALSVDNLLTVSYACDADAIQEFGSWLWANNLESSIYGNQTAPIENVVSCKRIPFDVFDHDHETQIKCGNLYTGVGIDPGTQQPNHKVTIANSTHIFPVGSIKVPVFAGSSNSSTVKGNFLDLTNKVSIYLPYIGIEYLPSNLLYRQVKDSEDGSLYITGRWLHVEYLYDMIYGTCVANVYVSKTENSKKNLIASFNGDCAIDIPVTSSNRASNDLAMKKAGCNMIANTLTGVVTGAVAGMLGGPLTALGGASLGAIAGVGTGLRDAAITQATQELHYTTSGGFSSQVASYMTKTVTLFIEHAKYTEPKQFAHQNGYPCNLSLNLSDLKGYTELDGEIEITFDCFEEERRAIKEALMQGFYI